MSNATLRAAAVPASDKPSSSQTPPAVFAFGSFSWEDLSRWEVRTIIEMVVFYIVGLVLWVIGCAVVWIGLLVPKFRRLTRRIQLIYR